MSTLGLKSGSAFRIMNEKSKYWGRRNMASRILHLAVSKADSHLKVSVCGNSKKTYDLDKFISLFPNEIKKDELYKGYYLHLIQDLVFRELMYDKYKWNPTIPGNVERLHNDYHLINLYVIKKYGITNDIQMIPGLEKEKIYSLYPYKIENFLSDMGNDFIDSETGEHFFFTKKFDLK